MTAAAPLTTRAAWKALDAHSPNIRELHLRMLFSDDATRGERMAVEAVGICFDYSKHRITDETLTLLLQLAEESGLRARVGPPWLHVHSPCGLAVGMVARECVTGSCGRVKWAEVGHCETLGERHDFAR